MMIITGPNMAGKSTYMRQVALITLMAHMGSFVPAASASIPLCDRIFTRVGASDDLAAGQSTFMVEMSEMASVKEHGDEIIFLRKIQKGGADSSFGVQVAAMAGLPQSLISRAHEIMAKLEANNVTQTTIGQNILGKKKQDKQMNLMEYNAVAFAQEIAQIDMDSMTPRDALNQLYLLREKARKI